MRVLFLEDNGAFAARVVVELEREGAVVSHVTRVSDARRMVDENVFDVALVDLRLGEQSGLDLIREVSAPPSPLRCVAFTVLDDRSTVLEAIDAGACGYVLKDESPARLVSLLRAAADGESPLSFRAASYVIDRARRCDEDFDLTPRELDVLVLVAKGMTYAESADYLSIGLGTVQSHIKNIYRKLGVTSKAEAAAWAVRNGLI